MGIRLSEEFTFRNNQDAFEKAGLFFSRIERLASSALAINEQQYGEFSDPLYRQDCLYYQLEAIRDLAGQFNELFDELAIELGRKTDLRLEALEVDIDPEAKLLAAYRASSKEDQDFTLVHTYFMSRKGWTAAMKTPLAKLAKLVVAESPSVTAQLAELLPKDNGAGVLAGNMQPANHAASLVGVGE